MTDDWEVFQKRDLSPKVWAKMKELGMEHLYVEVKGGDHSRFINANADTLEKIFAFFNIVRKDQRPRTN